jgi:hypothetical protein
MYSLKTVSDWDFKNNLSLYANYIRKKYITKLPVAKELPGII